MATGEAGDRGDAELVIERALEQLFRLHASRRVHRRRSTAAGVDVSQSGFQLLRRIPADGGMQVGELARRSEMDPAATGRQVGLLEAEGLVTREKVAGDGRAVLVRVTPAGAEARRRLTSVAERHMADVLAGWPAADREQLAGLLPRLVDGLRDVAFRSESHHEVGEPA